MVRMLLLSVGVNAVLYAVAPEYSTISKAESAGKEIHYALQFNDVRQHVRRHLLR